MLLAADRVKLTDHQLIVTLSVSKTDKIYIYIDETGSEGSFFVEMPRWGPDSQRRNDNLRKGLTTQVVFEELPMFSSTLRHNLYLNDKSQIKEEVFHSFNFSFHLDDGQPRILIQVRKNNCKHLVSALRRTGSYYH